MGSDKNTLDYYNSKAKEFVSGTVDVAFTEIQDLFIEYIPAGGKILDFGCGSGRDTKYFISKGYDVYATDGSEELCKIASEYTGIQVKQEGVHKRPCKAKKKDVLLRVLKSCYVRTRYREISMIMAHSSEI